MLRVTKLTDYATVVLTVLAAEPDAVLSAAGLAERAGLEIPTVAKVLKPLAQAGLVDGFRGASGGYRLARDPASINLVEMVERIRASSGRSGNFPARSLTTAIALGLSGPEIFPAATSSSTCFT